MTRDDLRRLAPLALAALAILALAAGLDRLDLGPGQPLRIELPATGAGGAVGPGLDIRLALVAFIWICVIAVAIGLAVSRSLRRYLLRTLPLYIIYGLLMYLLFNWLWSQSGAGSAGVPAPPPGVAEQPTPPPQPPAAAPLQPPDIVSNPPQWLVLSVSLLVGLALVGAIWLVARRVRRREPEDALAKLAREARSALSGMESGEGLRNAVLRCYAEMSRVLAEARGLRRDEAMTPREFEQRLAAAGVGDEHVRRLTRLFELVRYGPREPGEREEREAVACLSAIVEAYGKPR